jgi:hypothetical protein
LQVVLLARNRVISSVGRLGTLDTTVVSDCVW